MTAIREALPAHTGYVGIDIASQRDMGAVQIVWSVKDHWFTEGWYWTCQHTIDTLSSEQQKRYRQWADNGHLQVSPGRDIDQMEIEDQAISLMESYNIDVIGFDPWQAARMASNLEGRGAVTVEVRMGYKTMTPPTIEFLHAVKNQKMHHNGNPVLRWMIDSVVVRSDHRENMMPNKGASGKIDGLVALLMAMHLSIEREGDDDDSPYLRRGLRTL